MAFPTTPILDDFQRINEGPPPSADWGSVAGYPELVTLGNQCARNPLEAGLGYAYWLSATGASCEAYGTISIRPDDATYSDVFARAGAGMVGAYYVEANRNDINGDTIVISSDISGSLATYPISDFQDGDAIGIRCIGDTISAYYRPVGGAWGLLGSVMNSDNSLGGFIGINVDGDNERVDDFGGGTLAAWSDTERYIRGKLEVNWNKDGITWIDESARLIAGNGTQQTVPLWQLAGGAQIQPSWTASFRMQNALNRYSAMNVASPIYANIRYNKGHGIPIRFSAGLWTGDAFSYTRVFTGYIDDINIQSTRRFDATIVCIDNTLSLLQRKVTTTMYVDETVDSWLTVLAIEGNVASTDFDPGLCNIPYCWCDDENSWQEMCKAAHSEVGTLFFDRNGTLTFENVEAWAIDARHTISQHSFTVSRFRDLTFDFDWKDSYNEVLVEYQPRVQSGKSELYKIERAIRVLPGETRTFIARLRYPSPSINVPVAGTDFRVFDVLGNDLSATTTFGHTLYAQRVNVSVANGNVYRIAILYDYKITGRPILGYPALQEKYQATDADLDNPVTGLAKTLRISNNEYIQTQEQAQLIGALLRDRVKKTRLTYRLTDVPAIPTLQPGDRVTVAEAGAGINGDGFITTINWKYGGGAYTANYDILDAANWFLYTDYFLMGTDVLAITSKRVFY